MNHRIEEKWSASERKKRAKKCSNPKGFTMRQFCKNMRTRSKKGEKANEAAIIQTVYEKLLEECIVQKLLEVDINQL